MICRGRVIFLKDFVPRLSGAPACLEIQPVGETRGGHPLNLERPGRLPREAGLEGGWVERGQVSRTWSEPGVTSLQPKSQIELSACFLVFELRMDFIFLNG